MSVLIGQRSGNQLIRCYDKYACNQVKVTKFIIDYYIKYSVFIGISDTDKTDNLTCEIIYDNFTCENYRFSNNHHLLLMPLWIFYIARKDCS